MTDNKCKEDRDAILKESAEKGRSIRDMAVVFDVGPSTIRRWADKANIKFRAKSHWRKS